MWKQQVNLQSTTFSKLGQKASLAMLNSAETSASFNPVQSELLRWAQPRLHLTTDVLGLTPRDGENLTLTHSAAQW